MVARGGQRVTALTRTHALPCDVCGEWGVAHVQPRYQNVTFAGEGGHGGDVSRESAQHNGSPEQVHMGVGR